MPASIRAISSSTDGRARRLLGCAVGMTMVLAACGSGQHAGTASSTTRANRESTTTTGPDGESTTTLTTPPDAVLAAPLLPLYPFQTTAEAEAWRDAYRASNARPEFVDAGATALGFAHFLGYSEVDRVVATRADESGMHVSVGSVIPETSQIGTAAVVHLVRYMAGPDAPWEVVGTDDADFSITTPAYGAAIRSPLPIGGRISGVDESIRVHVAQLHANGFLGELCCVPAGGQQSPWRGTITFAAPADPILIVSASTGGHVRSVERFTVTGVRAP